MVRFLTYVIESSLAETVKIEKTREGCSCHLLIEKKCTLVRLLTHAIESSLAEIVKIENTRKGVLVIC